MLDDHPPSDPSERLRLAAMVMTLGDVQRALRHFLAIRELDVPAATKAQAHLMIGQSRVMLGQFLEAHKSFEAALEIDPQLQAARTGLERVRQLSDG